MKHPPLKVIVAFLVIAAISIIISFVASISTELKNGGFENLTIYFYNPSRYLIIVILSIVVIVLVAWLRSRKNSSIGGPSSSQYDWTKYITTDKDNEKDLQDKQIENMIMLYQAGQKAAERESRINIKCPNCGAPVKFSSKMICEYCHTEIARKSVAEQIGTHNGHEHISPEEYNPTRYYDENVTGYAQHDKKNIPPENYSVTAQ